jgi:hypothetical protein
MMIWKRFCGKLSLRNRGAMRNFLAGTAEICSVSLVGVQAEFRTDNLTITNL